MYDKPSRDGSSKLNVRPASGERVLGVVYEIASAERAGLDRAEGGYTPTLVTVESGDGLREALTYQYTAQPCNLEPYDWYVALAVAGAREHGLALSYIRAWLERD